MTIDARISTGLPSHPKTKKLIKRFGQTAGWNLVCLFLWAAGNRSDGKLSGMSDEDIELASDWQGEDGAFVSGLVSVGFLDTADDGYEIHNWIEHNPWAAGAEARSAKAKWNAAKRHHGVAEANRLVPEYAAIRNANSNAGSIADSYATSKDVANAQHTNSVAPSPSPSPISTTDVVDKRKRAVIQKPDSVCQEVWDSFVAVRKAKRAPISKIVIDGIEREATKAGISLEGALTVCCERGWQSFEAAWVNRDKPSTNTNRNGAAMASYGTIFNQQPEERGNGRTIDATPRLG